MKVRVAWIVNVILGWRSLQLICRDLCQGELLLIARAYLYVAYVEAVLRATSGQVLALMLSRGRDMTDPGRWTRSASAVRLDQLQWAATKAAWSFPRAACLTTAAAAFLMARRERIPVNLVLGAAITATGEFGSHAWLELDGEVMHENPSVARIYRPIIRY